MSLQRILSENMLRLNIKNLNEIAKETLLDKFESNLKSDYFSDTTYFDKNGQLIENVFFLQEQTKLRAAMSKVRQAIQRTPLMSRWQNWRTKKYIKKNGLPTQQQLMAKDSPEVKAAPGYNEVMFLLYNKRTRDGASIMYWNGTPALGGDGSETVEDKRNMGQLITQLARFNGLNIEGYNEPVKIELTEFIEALKKLYDQNIYLTSQDLLDIFTPDAGLALNALFTIALTAQWNGKPQDLNPQSMEQFSSDFYKVEGSSFDVEMERDLKRLQNFSTKLLTSAGGVEGTGRSEKGKVDSLATYEVSITDADKIKICQEVSTQFVTDKEKWPKLTLGDYTDFMIRPDELSIKSNVKISKEKVGSDEVEVVGTYYSYPDNPNDPTQANVIFGNNDNITEWQNTGPFVDAVKQRIDAIQADGWKILRVEYNAGARSSKVGTTKYGGTTDVQKTQGNVKLCQERATTITTQLGPLFKQLLPEAALMAGAPHLHANQGPGWYDYDNSEGQYGPLYEAYRQLHKDEDVTPRDFYGARNNITYYDRIKNKGFKGSQAQINAEYEQVYSKFRGTYAGYALYCYQETPITPKPQAQADIEIKTAGTWFFTLEYNVVTITDIGSSTKRWFKSRWRRVKRAFRRIDLSKIKFQSLGEGMNLIDICDAYN